MKYLYFVCLGVLLPFCGFPQENGQDYNFTNVGMTFLSVVTDARAGGMGELGVATSPDNYSHQQNPAKYVFSDLKTVGKGGINVFYMPWLRRLVDDMNIAGASGYYKVNSEQSVSFSFRYFSMGDLQETDDNLQALGERSPYEMAMDVAYARRLGRNFSMSMTFRYGVSNVVKKYRRAHIIAADLGGYYSKALRLGKNSGLFALGFALSNVGNKIKYGTDDRLFLPAELKLGSNLEVRIQNLHRFSIGMEGGKYLVSLREDDHTNTVLQCIGASFESGEIKRLFWKIGGEYVFNEILAFRTGYFYEGKSGLQREYATFGAGIRFMRIHLDASYLVSMMSGNHPLDNSLHLSAGIAF